MASEIKANKISPATGTAFTIGDSGDTFTLPSGATLAVASGATISNSGTQSGFGKLVQVVENSDVGTASTNGAVNWITTTTLATITPQKSGSTFFVSVNGVFNARPSGSGSGAAIFYKVNSGSYSAWLLDAGTGQEVSHIGVYVSGSTDTWFPASIQRYGSVTYTLGDTITFAVHIRSLFAGPSGSTTARWGLDTASTDNVNAITIMEVN
jgi:hypothetical protein